MTKVLYDGDRFPPEIIQQAIWLYLKFTLKFRNAEVLLAERGIWPDDTGLDISPFELVASAHSHDSAAKAVGLVTAGRVEALMKGSLHTDELMSAVVAHEGGIRTERRISHCFIMDVPRHNEPLIVTDAAVNIVPDLEAKVDIIRNAIDLAHAMGAPEVRVAILSALESLPS